MGGLEGMGDSPQDSSPLRDVDLSEEFRVFRDRCVQFQELCTRSRDSAARIRSEARAVREWSERLREESLRGHRAF